MAENAVSINDYLCAQTVFCVAFGSLGSIYSTDELLTRLSCRIG